MHTYTCAHTQTHTEWKGYREKDRKKDNVQAESSIAYKLLMLLLKKNQSDTSSKRVGGTLGWEQKAQWFRVLAP